MLKYISSEMEVFQRYREQAHIESMKYDDRIIALELLPASMYSCLNKV